MTKSSHIPDSELAVPTITLGLYRHYKGAMYEVIGVSLDTETLLPHVMYRPTAPSRVSYWTRPYAMFIEMVEVDGIKKPRFELEKEVT